MEENYKVFFKNHWHEAAVASLGIPVVKFDRNILSVTDREDRMVLVKMVNIIHTNLILIKIVLKLCKCVELNNCKIMVLIFFKFIHL